MPEPEAEHIEIVVIGGGQAGLSVGHHLARRGQPFLILDGHRRSATPGATAGTRFACSPRPATARWRGCRSRLRATRSRPRTRWPTTWRPTQPSLGSRLRPASAWTGSGGMTAGSWSPRAAGAGRPRSEEHTSELQSRQYLVCRLLLEKKKKKHLILHCGTKKTKIK